MSSESSANRSLERPAGIDRQELLIDVATVLRPSLPPDPTGSVAPIANAQSPRELADATLVTVVFTARWCLPWRLLRRQLDAQPLSSALVEVDVDVYPQLADRWSAVVLPTVVRCEKGVETKRWVGAVSVSELAAGEAITTRSAGMRRRR